MQIFTTSEALAQGLTHRDLRGPGIQRVFHGVYARATGPLAPTDILQAARRILPDDATLTGAPVLHLHGVRVGPFFPLPVISASRIKRAGIRRIPRRPQHPRGWLASPLDAIEEAGPGDGWVVAALDQLLRERQITHRMLASHPGASRFVWWVDPSAESMQESRCRFACVRS